MPTPQVTFDSVRMLMVHAKEVLQPEDFDDVVSSLNEWSCDVINGEVQVNMDEVPFPYEQGAFGE